MKVVMYLSSIRDQNSLSRKVVDLIKEELRDRYDPEFTIISANAINVHECVGCCKCFKEGICPLDLQDDMPAVKKALLEADIIALISPVYLHHVNSNMKKIIDRISYWTHLLKLTGKYGFGVSISSTNGNEHVDFYLKKVLESMGVITLFSLSCPLDLISFENVNELVKGYLNVHNYFDLKLEDFNTGRQEKSFTVFKEMYSHSNSYEAKYWSKNHLMDYNSFGEYFNFIKKD